jgi:hypothetical protein
VFTARSRRVLVLVSAALAVLLLAACGSSKKSSSGGASADPAAIVPANAPIYLEASVNPSANQKAAFNSLSQKILGVPNPGDKIIELINKSAKKDGVTYEKDIKPWLGEKVAVEATRLGSGNSSAFAVIIDTTNPDKALAAIQKGQTVTKGKVGDVSYIKTNDDTYAGTIDNYLVIGNREGFADVAAAQKGDKLADQPNFKAARAKAPNERLAYLYVGIDPLVKYAALTSDTLKSQAGTLKGLIGGIHAVSAWLIAAPSSVEIDVTTVPNKFGSGGGAPSAFPLAKAPGDAWAAATIRNVGPLLTKELNQLGQIGASSSGQNFQQILDQLKAATGLDVHEDLLSWMGDAGAFVRGTSLTDLGAAVVIKSNNPAKSQAAIGKIDDLLTRIGRNAAKLDVPGGTGIEISTTATGPKVQIAAVGQYFYIAFGNGALEDAMHPSTTLDSTPNFNAAVASLKGTAPSVYVDLQTVFGFVESLAPNNPAIGKVKPYLDAFTSLVAGAKNGVGKVVVNVKQGSATGLPSTTTPNTTPNTTPSTTDTNSNSAYFPGG